MADAKPSIDNWLDAPAETPFPQFKDDKAIDDFLDSPNPQTPTPQAIDDFLDKPEDTWAQSQLKAVKSIVPSAKQSLAGAVEQFTAPMLDPRAAFAPGSAMPAVNQGMFLGHLLTSKALQAMGIKDPIAETNARARQYFKDAQEDLQANQPNVDQDSLKGYAAQATQSLAQMLPGIAAGLATRSPTVGVSVMAAPIASQRFAQSIDEGRTAEQARADAALTFAAEAIPEMLPLGIIMKPGGTFLAKTFKAAGAGAISEMFTQAIEDGYSAGVLNENMTWKQAIQNLKTAGILGFATEGAVGLAVHPFLKEGAAETPPPGEAPPPTGPWNQFPNRGAVSDTGQPTSGAANVPAAAPVPPRTGVPSPEPSGQAAGATTLNIQDLIDKRVGLRREGGAPQPVVVESIQDGYVFFRHESGDIEAAPEGEFRRDLTTAPPSTRREQPDATTVPPIPKDREATPPPDVGDMNDFDPYAASLIAGQERAPVAPKPPTPQQALALPATERINDLRRAARVLQVNAAEAERIAASGVKNAKTPQEIASMRVQATSLMDQAAEQERNLTPKSVSEDVTAASQEQMAARRLGPLGRAAPETNEAVTGPQQFQVQPRVQPGSAAAPTAQGELAPVETSEAVTGPQQFQVRPKPAPKPAAKPAVQGELAPVQASKAETPPEAPAEVIPWQTKLRRQIADRSIKSLNDTAGLAKRFGVTPAEVNKELAAIAGSGKDAPIRVMQGKVKVDRKTGALTQSRGAGKFQYTPRATGNVVQDLYDFVLDMGGIRPRGFEGELLSRDLDKLRQKPGKAKLINPNARLDFEGMATAAMEDGFIVPTEAGTIYGQESGLQAVGATSPDLDRFMEMLEQNANGNRRHFRMGEEPMAEPEGERPATPRERKAAAMERFQELGLKPRGRTVAELEQELDEIENIIGDAPAEEEPDLQFAMEQEAVDRLSPEAQDAVRQETQDDYPDEWYEQEIAEGPIAEGTPPAQPEAAAGLPESRGEGNQSESEGGAPVAGESAAEAPSGAGAQGEQPAVKTERTAEGEQPVLIDVPKSAVQAQKAREAKFKGRMGTNAAQQEPGGMFETPEPDNQIDIENLSANNEQRNVSLITDKTAEAAAYIESGGSPSGWVLREGRRTGNEHLVIMIDGKAVGATTSDNPREVAYVAESQMYDPKQAVIIYHNHPVPTALSADDMRALGFPGTSMIVAIDHEGHVSAAALTPGVHRWISPIDPSKAATFLQHLDHHISNGLQGAESDAGKRQELALRAMAAAGVIEYHSGHPIQGDQVRAISEAAKAVRSLFEAQNIEIAPTSNRPAFHQQLPQGLEAISRRNDEIRAERQADEALRGVGGESDRGQDGGPQTARNVAEPGADRGAADGRDLEGPAETSTVLQRLTTDESGALTPPDWESIRNRFKGKNISRAARTIALGLPSSLRRFSHLGSFIQNAAWVASQDKVSATYFNAMLNQDHTKNALQNAAFEKVKPYAKLSEKDRATVNAMLEYYRLFGVTPQRTGRSLVVKIPDRKPPFGTARPTLSKPNQILAADKDMTAAIHSLFDMFKDTWTNLHEGMAREAGYTGEWSEAGIRRTIDGANRPRTKRGAEMAMRIWQNQEENRRQGYGVPLQRYGDTFISITPKVPEEESPGIPKPVHYEFVDTKSFFRDPFLSTRGGGGHQSVDQRVAELRKQYPSSQYAINTGAVVPKEIQGIDIPELERALALMQKVGNKQDADAVDRLLTAMYQKRKAGPRQQAEHVAGYSNDFERAITDYVQQMSSVISKLVHRDDVNTAYEATQRHGDERIRKYWEHYQTYMEKEGGDLNTLRKIGFYMMMWGNPSSAALDLTQTPLITQFQLGSWAGPRAAGLAHGAMLEAMGAVRASKGQGLMVDLARLGKTDAERTLIQEAAAEGRLGPQISKEFQGGDLSRRFPRHRPHMKKMGVLWNWGASMKNVAEEVNRIAALLAAHRAAQNPQVLEKAKKVYADDQLFQEQVGKIATPEKLAKFFLDDTQFIAGKINRAPGMRGAGGLVFQFKNYPLNYLRLMHKNFTRMGPEGKMVGGMMLAGLVLASGLLGAPFAEDLLKLEETIQQKITGIDPMWEYRFRKWISGGDDEGFRQFASEVITHGLARDIFGGDMGSRIGMGQLMPSDSLTDTVPLLSAIYSRGAEAVERLHRGQPLGALAALSNFVGGKAGYDWMRAFAQSQEGIKTQYGNTVVRPQDVTIGELVLRALGVQPTKVTRAQEKAYVESRMSKATQDAKNQMTTRLATLLVDAGDARKAGDDESYKENMAEFENEMRDAAAAFADPGTPPWQKLKPPDRVALKRRILAIIQPEVARLRGAPKLVRPEIINNAYPGE